jgi:hypothetical protein
MWRKRYAKVIEKRTVRQSCPTPWSLLVDTERAIPSCQREEALLKVLSTFAMLLRSHAYSDE